VAAHKKLRWRSPSVVPTPRGQFILFLFFPSEVARRLTCTLTAARTHFHAVRKLRYSPLGAWEMDKLSAEERVGVLFEACSKGRTDAVNQLLRAKLVDPSEMAPHDDQKSTSALHIACAAGQVDCVRALLKAGASTQALDSDELTPFQVATGTTKDVLAQELLQVVASGNVPMIRNLLHGGVSPDSEDGTPKKSSVLHWAASFGQPREVIAELAEAGADVNRVNSSNQTPLHEACEAGNLDPAVALVEFGASMEATDDKGQTPLDLVSDGQKDVFAEKLAEAKEACSRRVEGSGAKKVDLDELAELRRMNEEKDLTIVALRETVETVLEKEGVLKYISKLQEEYRSLSAQMQRVEDHKEHLESMYAKCDTELDRSQKENEALRVALRDKEQRLLGILERNEEEKGCEMEFSKEAGAASSSGNREENNNPALASSSTPVPSEMQESLDLIMIERDRLAQELESERRLRFSESRMHLGFSGQIRDQLTEAQDQVKALTAELHKYRANRPRAETATLETEAEVTAPSALPDDNRQRGYFSSIFDSLFGSDDEDDEDDDDISGDESPK